MESRSRKTTSSGAGQALADLGVAASVGSVGDSCDNRRIQRRLGYLSPDEYEAAYKPTQRDPATAGDTLTPTGVR